MPNDRFNENRLGSDHIGFAVASHRQVEDLLMVLQESDIVTAGIEFDPDNIQVEFYVGDYHNELTAEIFLERWSLF